MTYFPGIIKGFRKRKRYWLLIFLLVPPSLASSQSCWMVKGSVTGGMIFAYPGLTLEWGKKKNAFGIYGGYGELMNGISTATSNPGTATITDTYVYKGWISGCTYKRFLKYHEPAILPKGVYIGAGISTAYAGGTRTEKYNPGSSVAQASTTLSDIEGYQIISPNLSAGYQFVIKHLILEPSFSMSFYYPVMGTSQLPSDDMFSGNHFFLHLNIGYCVFESHENEQP
jgi:hypothetical protein